jgi:hypothetical protein
MYYSHRRMKKYYFVISNYFYDFQAVFADVSNSYVGMGVIYTKYWIITSAYKGKE